MKLGKDAVLSIGGKRIEPVVLTVDLSCLACKADCILSPFNRNIYVCFNCMQLYINKMELGGNTLAPSHKVKRFSATEWIIGSNVQTQKNTIWEQGLEHIYSLWIAKKVLE